MNFTKSQGQAPDIKEVEYVSEVQMSSPVITVWHLKNGLAWTYVHNGTFHTAAFSADKDADRTISALLTEYRASKAVAK